MFTYTRDLSYPVQGVPHLMPDAPWDMVQVPCDPGWMKHFSLDRSGLFPEDNAPIVMGLLNVLMRMKMMVIVDFKLFEHSWEISVLDSALYH